MYDCGARECPNNPDSYCDIDSGTCKLTKWVCEGVNTVEQSCGDQTAWKRWTLSGDKSSVSTATVCGFDDSVCNPDAGGGGSSLNSSSANHNCYYKPTAVGAVFAMITFLAGSTIAFW
ncbi:expressed unknown protein [Seminavis robusta]|uniref:Uncharacterized protein n=1 Tax=Seminavis robusta TaxID=568900 RepID=A0A9N8DCH9_9STRA|nr:expressed unknown protein [Seminavis robusta]|eukprot:Sro16_g011470.1 n/a (118) ;mRNA; f:5573-5926